MAGGFVGERRSGRILVSSMPGIGNEH